MAKYRLKIVFENKDVEETEVRFYDILNSKDVENFITDNFLSTPIEIIGKLNV